MPKFKECRGILKTNFHYCFYAENYSFAVTKYLFIRYLINCFNEIFIK